MGMNNAVVSRYGNPVMAFGEADKYEEYLNSLQGMGYDVSLVDEEEYIKANNYILSPIHEELAKLDEDILWLHQFVNDERKIGKYDAAQRIQITKEYHRFVSQATKLRLELGEMK